MRAEVTPYFENTRQYALYDNSNVLKAYYIEPVEGYVLHDNAYDSPVFDENTMSETGEIILGYTPSSISVWANYDFEANPREIYAVLRRSVPEEQIFGSDSSADRKPEEFYEITKKDYEKIMEEQEEQMKE